MKNRFPRLGLPIGTIFAVFDLQVIPMLSTKFQVNWPFGSGESSKQIFQIGKILAIFYLQITPMLPIKFRVNMLNSSGVEVQNRFSRWPKWGPYWISEQNDFSFL